MKAIRLFMMLVLFSCVFGTIDALAGNVYGTSAVIYDFANNRTRGYHRTQLDYDTAEYYTAYVCGELYKDGVYQVRSCQSGFITATIYTQYTGTSSTGSVLSDHYVDMKYFDEEQQSYVDDLGYRFSSGSYPGDWFFYPADIFGYFNPVSIHLGSTTAVKPLVKISAASPDFNPEPISISPGTGKNTEVTVNVFSSPECTGDPNCLIANDEVFVEIIEASTGGTFTYAPTSKNKQVPLNLGATLPVRFGLTVGTPTAVKTYDFIIRIADVRRPTGGDGFTSILSNVQLDPTNGSVLTQLTATN